MQAIWFFDTVSAKRLQCNVFKIGTIRTLSMGGAFIVGFLPEFLEKHGESLWTLESFFAAAMLCCIVPSGYGADKFGKRAALVCGGLLLLSGSLTYALGSGFVTFLLAEIMLGAGIGFILGTDEAFLHSALKEKDQESEFTRVWGKILAIEVIFAALAFIAGDYAGRINERLPFWLAAGSYAGLLLTALMLTEPTSSSDNIKLLRLSDIWRAARYCTVEAPKVLWVIANYAFMGGCLRVLFWTYPGYVKESQAVVSIGWVLAMGSLVTAYSSSQASRFWVGQCRHKVVTSLLLLLALSTLATGYLVNCWAFVLVSVHQYVRGSMRVVLTNYLHQEINCERPELRATIASLRDMAFLVVYLVLLQVASLLNQSLGVTGLIATLGWLTLLFAALSNISARYRQ